MQEVWVPTQGQNQTLFKYKLDTVCQSVSQPVGICLTYESIVNNIVVAASVEHWLQAPLKGQIKTIAMATPWISSCSQTDSQSASQRLSYGQ